MDGGCCGRQEGGGVVAQTVGGNRGGYMSTSADRRKPGRWQVFSNWGRARRVRGNVEIRAQAVKFTGRKTTISRLEQQIHLLNRNYSIHPHNPELPNSTESTQAACNRPFSHTRASQLTPVPRCVTRMTNRLDPLTTPPTPHHRSHGSHTA